MEMRAVIVGEGVSCLLMVLMEGCSIGLTIMASTIMSRGMSPYVFVVYTNALSSIFLLPHSFTFYTSQRKAKIEWRSTSFQAKIAGTLISIMGAVSLTLYKGPVIKYSHHLQLSRKLFLFSSSHQDWILGAILLAAASFTISIWNIIQVDTLQAYPEAMTIVSFYILFGTILSAAVVSLFIEKNPSVWTLKPNMELLVIILTAVFSSIIRIRVQKWCMRSRGPFYVPMFKPLGIPIATMCGCLFFAYTFHYGSIMGAFTVGLGTYMVIWGHIVEDEVLYKNKDSASSSILPDENVPLLQEDSQV